MTEKKYSSLSRIRTGSFERRLSLTRSGLLAGSRYMAQSAASLWLPSSRRAEKRRESLGKQARFLVHELGKLKGSVVKIGQMMALYGEHFLPEEVTEALHTLEDSTEALAWPAVHRVLVQELGAKRLAEFDIDPQPIAAASLGQVHLARLRSDDSALCLKIQYPEMARAIDSDIDAVAQLMRMARLVKADADFSSWLDEVRQMLHREVDYTLEASTTRVFGDRVKRDRRYVVPRIYDEYTTARVLASSFEPGFSVTSVEVEALTQERRNQLGRAVLELFLREIFVWSELQTDPNFGNYRIRPAQSVRGRDRLVLLDFGAVQQYPASFIEPLREMIRGAYFGDLERVRQGALGLGFIQADYPQQSQRSFAQVCAAVIEPLVCHAGNVPAAALNSQGQYRWRESDLPTRVARQAAKAAFSQHFRVPPREFLFLNRKLIGVYTLIAVLGAEFNGADIIEPYL